MRSKTPLHEANSNGLHTAKLDKTCGEAYVHMPFTQFLRHTTASSIYLQLKKINLSISIFLFHIHKIYDFLLYFCEAYAFSHHNEKK